MEFYVNNGWNSALSSEFDKEYYLELSKFVDKEYEEKIIYPPKNEIFTAFEKTDLKDVKVVILGQDPYHEKGQAHGLAFSVKEGVKVPPSLVNIYKEINNEYGYDIPDTGYLIKLAKQGVLLLNTVLTVREGEANSHRNKGWESFTDECLKVLNREDRPIVYMLWGNPSIKKEAFLNNEKQLVLKGPHPSPLSAYRGFFGCGHFKECNNFLKANGISEIDWKI